MRLKSSEVEEEIEIVEDNMAWLMGGVDIPGRKIDYRGPVTEQMTSIITRSISVMCEVSHDPIKIFLSSEGGDAYEGLAIYDFLRACPADIHIHATGKIWSAAFIVYLAGDIRTSTPNTAFMMHSTWYSPPEGNVKVQENDLLEAKRVNNVFLDIMAARTNRNRKFWYRTVLSLDKYFDLSQAKDMGLVTTPKKVVKKNVKTKI